MASETAPAFNTSIFNQANFNTSGGDALDYAYLASHYLQYPTGQTAVETIYDLVVSNSGVNNNLEIGTAPIITAGIGGVGGTTNPQSRTALGSNALIVSASSNGVNNTALGSEALASNTTSVSNTAVGYLSLHNNTNSTGFNTAVGADTLSTTGGKAYNTAFGYQALDDLTSGDFNTSIGRAVGGSNTGGTDNTAVGRGSQNSANYSGTIAIGNNAEPDANYQIRIGDETNTNRVYFPVLKPQYSVASTDTSQIGSRAIYTYIGTNITIGTTMTNITSFTLPIGAWIICAFGTINMTTIIVGYNILTISTNSGTDTGINTTSTYASTTNNSTVSVSGVFNFTSSTTVYINAQGTHSSSAWVGTDDKNTITAFRVA